MIKQLKRYKAVFVIGLVYIILAFIYPEIAKSSFQVSTDYLKEMLMIMPPVLLLMGLIDVWIPKEKIQKWLGKGSGLKGILLSIGLGTLPTGPLYVAFPMAATLLKKKASIFNIALFLGAWGALKIPQLMIEAKFLGIEFTIVRFSLTLVVLLIIGTLMEMILKDSVKESLDEENV